MTEKIKRKWKEVEHWYVEKDGMYKCRFCGDCDLHVIPYYRIILLYKSMIFVSP